MFGLTLARLFGPNRLKQIAAAKPVLARSPVTTGDVKSSEALNGAEYRRGVMSARKRILAILDLPEAKGRYDAAVNLACTTRMPVAVCRSYLRSMPMSSGLAAAMALVPNPDVGPGWPSDGAEPTSSEQLAQRIIGAPRAEVDTSKPTTEKTL